MRSRLVTIYHQIPTLSMFLPSNHFHSARLEDFTSVGFQLIRSNSIYKFYQLINSDFQSWSQTKEQFFERGFSFEMRFSIMCLWCSIKIRSFSGAGHRIWRVHSLVFATSHTFLRIPRGATIGENCFFWIGQSDGIRAEGFASLLEQPGWTFYKIYIEIAIVE